jgi:hypothetical protein
MLSRKPSFFAAHVSEDGLRKASEIADSEFVAELLISATF